MRVEACYLMRRARRRHLRRPRVGGTVLAAQGLLNSVILEMEWCNLHSVIDAKGHLLR